MAVSSGRSPHAAVVALVVLAASAAVACGPKKAAAPVDPNAGLSRGEIEMELRQRMGRVEGDACAKESWLKKLIPGVRGLEFEVAEELLAEQASGCRKSKKAGEVAGGAALEAGAAAGDGKDPAAAVVAAAAGDGKEPAAATGTGDGKEPAAATGDEKTPATAPAPADKDKAAPAPAEKDRPALPPEPVSGACNRRRAEADLRAKNPHRALNRANIDAEFQRCFAARLASCQLALDADVDEGFACWKADPWPEVPASVNPEDIAKTGMCLLELKAVIADLRKCRAKKPADLDACVAPYIGYSPQCALLKAERVWKAFPGREDVERVAKADAARRTEQDAKAAKIKAEQDAKAAKLKAEQDAKEAKLKAEQDAKKAAEEAKLAKEVERCSGRTTLEFAEKLKAQPGPRTVPGCRYQVVGRVVSRNNVFVQVADPSGGLIVLLRTKETFADGETIADRMGTFDSLEEVELADGSKRAFAVFKLEPAPPKK